MANNFESISWKKRFLELSKHIASWSKDPSRHIGAVIVGNHGEVISQGYNGFPRGIADTPERLNDRPTKYKYVVHAEMNALYNASLNGVSTAGSTIYVTGLPVCHECAKAIIQSGIKKVIMNTKPIDNWKESGELSLEMFKEAGIEFEFIEEE